MATETITLPAAASDGTTVQPLTDGSGDIEIIQPSSSAVDAKDLANGHIIDPPPPPHSIVTPQQPPSTTDSHSYDIIIVGAGISGINMAYRTHTSLRGKSYVVLEARAAMGGTWDLMRYPGVRSDSDLHTFGFAWRPWTMSNPIARGGAIVQYLKESAAETGIEDRILYRHKVRECCWRSREQSWTLEVEETLAGGAVRKKAFRAKFVVLGTGYYDYDTPLETTIPGLDKFKGRILHPQFWPPDLEYENKKIAVIGSGATAITLIPALAEKAAKVTMVQRSPGYVVSIPNRVAPKKWWERILPAWLQHRITRLRYLWGGFSQRRFLSDGEKTRKFLAHVTQLQLPKHIPYDPHFKPAYAPWTQRMCLCPDGDFFKSLRSGVADVATGQIKTMSAGGIELASGQTIDADMVVTATGLRMQYGGNAAIIVDGERIAWGDKFMWHGVMIQDMPNLAIVQGYTKASWTLGADATAHLVVRMIKHMDRKGMTSATPRVAPGRDMVRVTRSPGIMGLTSTYIMDAMHRLPKTSDEGPWKARGNFVWDLFEAKYFASMTESMQFVKAVTA
jgi:cation diffusion facilitator CzcD-associated flavoprotein CzcO